MTTSEVLSQDDIRGLAARHGISDVDTASAIAMAESQGHTDAHGDTTLGSGQGSWGLWQVYLDAHPEYANTDLTDPDNNAAAMAAISSGGTNWQPWSTYTNGAYKQYMPATPTDPAQVALLAATSLPASAWGWVTSLSTPVKVLAGVGVVFAGGLVAAPGLARRAWATLFGG